jgi:beta-glucosidase
VSDYTAIMELVNHGVAADEKEAAYLAFRAGVDIDLVAECYSRFLPALVAEGRIAEADIDAACRRILVAKVKLGLFDNPYRGLDEDKRVALTLTRETRALAREAAAKSCVLLKNDGVLPLRRDAKIALVGPLADSRGNMQGTWAVAAQPQDSVTVLEGMRAAFGGVAYAKGANIIDDPNIAARLNLFGETVTIDPAEALIAEAVAQANKADVVVACMGEAREHTGEAATRTTLELPGSQRRLLEALAATGKPLVIVTISGRPLALSWEDGHANAILHAWFPGSEAGHAIADLLSGAVNPSGKLAMSFPRDSGQVPITYAEPPTGRPGHLIGLDTAADTERDAQGRPVFRKFTTACRIEGASTPLYPFGHGLSYARFDYGEVEIDTTELHGDAALTASVTVRNAGAVAGEEVVQLYIGDPVASRARPVRELKGFQKIALAPGKSQTVSFRITTAELSFIRAETLAAPEQVIEPGEFVIEIGGSLHRLGTKGIVWRS